MTTVSQYLPPAGGAPVPGPRPGPVDRPGNYLAARFGRDAAHAEWFYDFRLAVKTDVSSCVCLSIGDEHGTTVSATSLQ